MPSNQGLQSPSHSSTFREREESYLLFNFCTWILITKFSDHPSPSHCTQSYRHTDSCTGKYYRHQEARLLQLYKDDSDSEQLSALLKCFAHCKSRASSVPFSLRWRGCWVWSRIYFESSFSFAKELRSVKLPSQCPSSSTFSLFSLFSLFLLWAIAEHCETLILKLQCGRLRGVSNPVCWGFPLVVFQLLLYNSQSCLVNIEFLQKNFKAPLPAPSKVLISNFTAHISR